MRLLCPTLLLIVVLHVAGCGSPAKKSGLMKTTPAGSNITVSAEQLRIQVRSLVDPFSGRIEEAADEIIAGSDDPRVRLAALEWKANTIPALRESLFRPDPLAAVMDAWALAKQMEDYFETGDGRRRFGTWADAALAASRDLERDFEAFLASTTASGDISEGRQFIDRWAVEHPIRGSIAGRQSILNEIDDVRIKGGVSGFKALGGLSVGMDDLSRRMEVYSAQLPKIASWQAEIMLLKMLGDEASDPPLAALPELMDTAVDLGATVEDLPDLVASEREAIFEAVRVERLETLEFIQAERKAILAWASQERAAILAEVDTQRQAATADLVGELQRAIATFQGERDQTLDAAEQISTRTIDHSVERAEGLINHVFLRLLQLLGIALVGALLLLFLARLLLRGKTA